MNGIKMPFNTQSFNNLQEEKIYVDISYMYGILKIWAQVMLIAKSTDDNYFQVGAMTSFSLFPSIPSIMTVNYLELV